MILINVTSISNLYRASDWSPCFQTLPGWYIPNPATHFIVLKHCYNSVPLLLKNFDCFPYSWPNKRETNWLVTKILYSLAPDGLFAVWLRSPSELWFSSPSRPLTCPQHACLSSHHHSRSPSSGNAARTPSPEKFTPCGPAANEHQDGVLLGFFHFQGDLSPLSACSQHLALSSTYGRAILTSPLTFL